MYVKQHYSFLFFILIFVTTTIIGMEKETISQQAYQLIDKDEPCTQREINFIVQAVRAEDLKLKEAREHGNSFVHEIVYHQQLKLLEALYKHVPDKVPVPVNAQRSTPLIFACALDSIREEEKINQETINKMIALFCQHYSPEQINIVNKQENAALSWSIVYNNTAGIESLLDAHAQVSIEEIKRTDPKKQNFFVWRKVSHCQFCSSVVRGYIPNRLCQLAETPPILPQSSQPRRQKLVQDKKCEHCNRQKNASEQYRVHFLPIIKANNRTLKQRCLEKLIATKTPIPAAELSGKPDLQDLYEKIKKEKSLK